MFVYVFRFDISVIATRKYVCIWFGLYWVLIYYLQSFLDHHVQFEDNYIQSSVQFSSCTYLLSSIFKYNVHVLVAMVCWPLDVTTRVTRSRVQHILCRG